MSSYFIIFNKVKKGEQSHLEITGFTTRDVAHTYGVPHAAVQVAVMIEKEKDGKLIPHVLLHQRSEHKKIDPLKWDICGGHIDAEDSLIGQAGTFSFDNLPDHWRDPAYIDQLFWDAAIREANEEVHFIHSGFVFKKEHLQCVGGIGAFSSGFDQPTAINREYSSFFLAKVPADILKLNEHQSVHEVLYMEDSVGIDGKTVDLKIEALKLLTFTELIDDYQDHPEQYADGISRVLKQVPPNFYTEQSRSIIPRN